MTAVQRRGNTSRYARSSGRNERNNESRWETTYLAVRERGAVGEEELERRQDFTLLYDESAGGRVEGRLLTTQTLIPIAALPQRLVSSIASRGDVLRTAGKPW